MLGTIKELWRYPVKSMQGELVEHNYVTWSGLLGDRRFSVVNHDGVVITAKTEVGKQLLQCRASWPNNPKYECDIDLPNGRSISQLFASSEVSDLLGEIVHIIDLRADPWIECHTNHPGLILRPGVGVDSSPVHMVSTAALATMSRAEPGGMFDALHFRPNFVVGTPEVDGFPEDEWIGRMLKVGEDLVLLISEAAERGIEITWPQAGKEANPKVLSALRRHHHDEKGLPLLGVYASIVKPGVVRVGDEISFA